MKKRLEIIKLGIEPRLKTKIYVQTI